MRLSRPCYDKPRRCPGWAGGGWKYPRRSRCDNGHIEGITTAAGRYSRWRVGRCDTCDVVTLPYAVSLLSPVMWWWHVTMWWRRSH